MVLSPEMLAQCEPDCPLGSAVAVDAARRRSEGENLMLSKFNRSDEVKERNGCYGECRDGSLSNTRLKSRLNTSHHLNMKV